MIELENPDSAVQISSALKRLAQPNEHESPLDQIYIDLSPPSYLSFNNENSNEEMKEEIN